MAREEKSDEIWIRAADIEGDIEKAKQLLIKKAVTAIPACLESWSSTEKSTVGSNEAKDLLLHILSTNPDISSATLCGCSRFGYLAAGRDGHDNDIR